VTIGSALLASLVSPIPFPFNILISFGLGGTALYGARKILDPRTISEVTEQQTDNDFHSMLSEMSEIASRTMAAGKSKHVGKEEGGRLVAMAGMIYMILKRYQERKRDFAGVSSTLLVLQQVDGILAYYLKVRQGELFLDRPARKVISETGARPSHGGTGAAQPAESWTWARRRAGISRGRSQDVACWT
jgi:hypothetical protein